MKPAEFVHDVAPGIWEWSAYSEEHRVELTSHAVRIGDGLDLIDPIAISEKALESIVTQGPIRRILQTNANHPRHSEWFAERFGVSVDGANALTQRSSGAGWEWTGGGWCVWKLPGGAESELALHDLGRSFVVFGDAVVNLRGLELLPDKYCLDPTMLRTSLAAMLEAIPEFECALFAHGAAVRTQARSKILAALIQAQGKP